VCKLTGLTYLNLADTGLLYLPLQLKGLTRLAWLDLSGNLLAKEDVQILATLTSLKSLSLRIYTSEVAGLSRLQALERLDLSGNPLGSLPTFLKGLKSLADLRLSAVVTDSDKRRRSPGATLAGVPPAAHQPGPVVQRNEGHCSQCPEEPV